MQNKEIYKGLPQLSYGIRWLEELIGILSRPFLMIGFVVSMIDLLTQGRLLSSVIVYYGWAIVQAVAVDAAFFVTWARVERAFKDRNIPAFIGQTALGLGLGFIAWAAMDIQSLQQALNLTNVQALQQLGLNIVLLTHVRSAVAIGLAAVVAMRNHTDETEQVLRGSWFIRPKWLKRRIKPVNQSNSIMSSPPNQSNRVTGPLRDESEPTLNQTGGDSEPLTEPSILHLVQSEVNPVGKREQVKQVLVTNRTATLQEIMDRVNVSKTYASQLRAEVSKELYGEPVAN